MTSKYDTLIKAASNGDCETLKSLLQPNLLQTLQEADLTLEQLIAPAANNRHAQVVEYCISLGANVHDFEVLRAVIQGNSLDVYKVVVPAGYNLNYDHGGIIGGPLCWVGNDVPLAAYLLTHGANPNSDLQTRIYQPLALAARNPNDSVEMIELFITHGAQIDRSGALIVAAQYGNLEAVRCLISHGANVNLIRWTDAIIFTRPNQVESALHRAVKGGHEAVVALLLEKGADMSLEDANGKTALDVARELEKDSMVRLLHNHGS
jgi:ankyrin repeat protein